MPKNNETTTKFKVDISELKKGITEANRQIRLANAQFKAASSGMENWGESVDGVGAKLKQLEKVLESEKAKLNNLEKQLALTEEEFGENSAAADELRIKIANQQAVVNTTTAEFKKYESKLADIRSGQADTSSSANDQRNAFEKLNDTISEQEKELDALKDEYANAVIEQGKHSDAAKELAQKIQNLSSDLRDNKTTLNDAAREGDNLDASLKDVEKSADKASDGFTVMKGAIAVLIADGLKALAATAIDTMKTLILETDAAYDNFQAKTGTATEAMGEFQEVMDELYYSGMGESMDDIANAMAEIKQQTKETDPNVLKDLTNNAIALRDTFGYDVKESMRAVNMLMEQFGLTSDEAFNLIVQGAQNGLDKNGDLLDTINEYSVHYQQMGYDADDFFNSLANGTAAGTFSVDKLGDAMKEFGIRTKDTGTATAEAFDILGYGSKDRSEAIKKWSDTVQKLEKNLEKAKRAQTKLNTSAAETKTKNIEKLTSEIAKLEKNLKYAKEEQAGFNEKTSDLTRMKNADKIAEYSSKLEDAKNELAELSKEGYDAKTNLDIEYGASDVEALTKELADAKTNLENLRDPANDTGKSLEDIQEKFAQGGEAAQEATEEILEALLSMEDPVKQNAAGVGLFGTMWEDLGIEGVKALVKTEGELKKTKKSMEELNKVRYDNIKSKFTVIGRTLQKDLLVPLAEKLIPKVEKFTNYIIENSDEVANKIKIIGTVIATVFVVNKIAKFVDSIKTMVTTFKSVTDAIKATTAAQTTLNAVQSATPWGAIALAVGGIATAVGAWAIATGKLDTELDPAVKKIDEFNNKIAEQTKNFKDAKDARDKSVQNTEAEFGYYNTLVDELSNIIDANGKVKTGYEERAETITSILSEALGEEINLDKLVADGKQNVIDKINELIIRKKADAQMATYEQHYTEAIQNQANAYKDLVTAKDNVKTITDLLAEAKAEEQYWQEVMDASIDKSGPVYQNYTRKLNAAKEKTEEYEDKLKDANKTLGDTETTFLDYQNTIENYEGVTSAIIEGDVDKINTALVRLTNGFINAENGTKESLEQQVTNAKKMYEDLKKAFEAGEPGVTKQMVDNAKNMVDSSVAELSKFEDKAYTEGEDGGKATAKGMKATEGTVKNAGKDVANKGKEGLESVDTESSGTNFIQGFINSLKSSTTYQKLSKTISNVGTKIKGWFNKSLDEHSPSKFTMKSGQYFLEGFSIGLDKYATKVGQHVQKIGTGIAEDFSSAVESNSALLETKYASSVASIKKLNVDSAKSGLIGAHALDSNANAATNVTNVYNNFTQNNTSPKALSALEIYRRTKNQLNFAKGV